MANTAAILVALLLNFSGVCIFRRTQKITGHPSAPVLTSFIFQIGVYFHLLDSDRMPRAFRKLHPMIRFFIELTVAAYFFETALTDFWLPLESFIFRNFICISMFLKKIMPRTGCLRDLLMYAYKILSMNCTSVFICYAVSMFFTLVLAHGSRAIDMRLLFSCGPSVFFDDMCTSAKEGFKQMLKEFIPVGRTCTPKRRRRRRRYDRESCRRSDSD